LHIVALYYQIKLKEADEKMSTDIKSLDISDI